MLEELNSNNPPQPTRTNKHTHTGADSMTIACNTTTTLTCRGRMPYPVWYINETLVVSNDSQTDYTFGIDTTTGDFTATLMIDGNETSGTMNFRCTVENQDAFTTTLIIQGL